MRVVRRYNRMTRATKYISLIALGGYACWNAAWLVQGRLPPSIFRYFTGLPCPTTGMARSLLWICRGDVGYSLLFNPLTFVYLGLIVVSGGCLLRCVIQHRERTIPPLVAWVWFVALAVGWAAKFALGSKYW